MGASVRRRAGRSGEWVVYFTSAGRRWNKTYGPTAQDEADAREAAEAFNAEHQAIQEVRESLYPGGAAPFKAIATAWWDVKSSGMPASSVDSKRCVIYTRLIPFFGATDLRRIDDDRIRACAVRQAEVGHARETVETTGSMLDQILSWGVARSYADRCPALKGFGGEGVRAIFRKVAAAKCRPSARIESWTREEVATLIQCARERGEWLSDPLIFLAMTGCRRGEMIALEWPDVDLERGRALIRQSYSRGQLKATKADKIRPVDLSPDAVRMLKRRAAENRTGRVFRGRGGRNWTDRGFNSSWQRARKFAVALGVRKFKLHVFRHTWASWALAAGHDAVWAAGQLGDTLDIFLRRYVHEVQGPRRSLDFLSLTPVGGEPPPAPDDSAARAEGAEERPALPRAPARLH